MAEFRLRDFVTGQGVAMGDVTIAYQTYGRLSAARDNAILVTHGLTSSHWAAEPATLDSRVGWGELQIGSGLLYDTDRWFVISSNVLGSPYGSTSAASRNPQTGQAWGRNFPLISMQDVVRAQAELVTSLGIGRLHAVAGCSLGGFQAYQWAVSFPDRLSRMIATDTADHDSFDLAGAIPGMIERFARNAGWNDGQPAPGALTDELASLRTEMLIGFGLPEKLAQRGLPQRAISGAIAREARDWAEIFDPWVLVSLYRTAASFDVRDALARISVPVLLVMTDTDRWYPPAVARAQMARLRAAGVQVSFHQVESALGHYATTEEPEKWAPVARAFLDRPVGPSDQA